MDLLVGEGMSRKPEIEISVAICTRDRRDSLLRAVASLARPACARWELLVVDNASRDDTRAACQTLVDDFPAPMRVLAEPVPGLSHARNRALAEAEGRAVVFLDDDATCHAGFVDAHARAFEDEGVVASGGRILPVLQDSARGAWRRHLEREQLEPVEAPEPAVALQALEASAAAAQALRLALV